MKKQNFTKEQIRFWMESAAWANGHRLGRMQNGKLCIYRKPVHGFAPTRLDVVVTEDEFIRDMERGWN